MNPSPIIRVRFAPSPTGNLHIGSIRTALFNWLFAKKSSGKFILRIEDTDKIRSTKEFENNIYDSLKWLGLNWNEEPYRQSERLETYKKYAEDLLKKGFAYEDNGAIKFKITDSKISFVDIVRGEIEFDSKNLEDFVIIKGDGMPTYNFAASVDDTLMEITHVIRGEDHIPNTPKQILIYKALEFNIPQFAHIPLIHGMDKKRLSKRDDAVAVTEYREAGYLPEAIINFLALLGWAYDDKQVIFSVAELISKFSLEKISRNPAIFDKNKLDWINGYYIRNTDTEKIAELCLPYLKSKGFIKEEYRDYEYIKSIIYLEKDRLKVIKNIVDRVDFYFIDDIKYDNEVISKVLKNKNILKEFLEEIKQIEEFSPSEIEKITKSFIEKNNYKLSELVHPVRVAITGSLVSAGLFETIAVLGKEKCISRIEKFLKLLQLGLI